MIKNALIFRYENAIIQTGVGNNDAVEWVPCPGDFQGPTDERAEVLLTDYQADPVRQVGNDRAGIVPNPVDFKKKLQLQPDDG